MKYSVTRLCGGKALMVSVRNSISLKMKDAAAVLSAIGVIKSYDDMMLVMSWKDMEVTLYSQGKIMFYPLDDRNAAISYADEIFGVLQR